MTASRAVRRELWDAYALFVAAYRAAAEKLLAEVRDVGSRSEASPSLAVRGRVDRRGGRLDLMKA
jgi:hypothetical protein